MPRKRSYFCLFATCHWKTIFDKSWYYKFKTPSNYSHPFISSIQIYPESPLGKSETKSLQMWRGSDRDWVRERSVKWKNGWLYPQFLLPSHPTHSAFRGFLLPLPFSRSLPSLPQLCIFFILLSSLSRKSSVVSSYSLTYLCLPCQRERRQGPGKWGSYHILHPQPGFTSNSVDDRI